MLYSNNTYTIQRLGVAAFIFFHLNEFALPWKSEQLHELYPPPPLKQMAQSQWLQNTEQQIQLHCHQFVVNSAS